MQFSIADDQTEIEVWNLIIERLSPDLARQVSPASSSFYKTADGLECAVRSANGSLIATCYSESDRMGNRRWTIELSEKNLN